MRKVFPFEVSGLKPPRVVDGIKNKVRKYLKRERRKALPVGADYWDFDCRVGRDRESPEPTHVAELIHAIDKAAAEEWAAIYVEILAKPGVRVPKPKPAAELDTEMNAIMDGDDGDDDDGDDWA